MRKLFLFVGMLLFCIVSIARGDSFHCGNRVVSTGDSKMDVLSKCGPPDDSETVSYDTKGTASGEGSVDLKTKKVDKLYYNCGDSRFIRLLTVIDGKLVKIENGGYGSGAAKCE
jgi:Protein of unknown function (DUF2845)